MKPNLSLIFIIRDFGSGQIRATETILSFAGICKNCAMAACPPGQIRPKVPGLVSADGATNVYSLNRRAVIANVNVINEIASDKTTPLYTATAYLAHLLLRDTQPNSHAKSKEPNSLAPF